MVSAFVIIVALPLYNRTAIITYVTVIMSGTVLLGTRDGLGLKAKIFGLGLEADGLGLAV